MLITKKNILFFAMSSCSIFPTIHASFFDQVKKELHDIEERMEQCFARQNEINKKSFKQLNIAMEQSGITITENKNAHKVDVVIAPLTIKDPSFDASFDPDKNVLDILTPAGKIMLQTEHHMVCVSFDHQVQVDQQDSKAKVMLSSSNQIVTKINDEVALEEAAIEYDQEAKKLTISLPLRKKMTTKIPVSVKEIAKK